MFWKVFKGTKWVRAAEADLWTGKAAIDAEVWVDAKPRNFWEKASSAPSVHERSLTANLSIDLDVACVSLLEAHHDERASSTTASQV